MHAVIRLLVATFILLVAGPVWAQDNKGYLGVDLQDISKEEADKLGWDTPHGARVTKAREGGPAAAGGLLANDIILVLDGVEVENKDGFIASIGGKGAGAQVRLRLLRDGRERSVNLTLGRRPVEQAQQQQQVIDANDVPILQLDTGAHMALIKGIAFTPDGKQLVSASDDKTIRVWDWQSGKTVRIIRGNVGPSHEGKYFSMALSPDGRWIAAGGWLHKECAGRCGEIRLFDFSTGRLVALLNKGHVGVVSGLAFSRDGKLLMSGSGLQDLTAIIWDVENRKMLHQLRGHTDQIYALGFSPDKERAYSGGYDRTVKMWSVRDGKEIMSLTGHKDKVQSLAVSPTDGTLATGGWDGETRLWDGRTGRYIRSIQNQGALVGSLNFTPDGKLLVSGTGGTAVAFVWEVATGKTVATYNKHDNVVVASAISPDGRLVATAGGNAYPIHIWETRTGQGRQILEGTGKNTWSVGFSRDGQTITWGTSPQYVSHNSRGPLELQLKLPNAKQPLGQPETVVDAASFVRAFTTFGPYSLVHRKGGDFGYDAFLDIQKDGKTVASIQRDPTSGYGHWSYSFTPDGQTIISGDANGTIQAYDLTGKKIGDFIGHQSVIWALAPSADGRYLISGAGDQTVRLWNLQTRELIVTLFRGVDGEWVTWTPQGYYMGSPGADTIVGWQMNKGPESAADYVGADQLRTHLNRPDIVEKAIVLASAERAVRESFGTTFKLSDLLARPVPKFRIVSPAAGSSVRSGRAEVKIDVEAVRDPIKVIRVQVNGRQVDEITPEMGTGGFSAGLRTLDIPLGKGRNDIRITLSNDIGDKAETVTLNQEGEGVLDERGTLYILAIGVDQYPKLGQTCGATGNGSCDLRYSGADARKWVEAAERRLGPAHSKVVKRTLINGANWTELPTAGNILDAIDLLKQAKETDTVMLFIAGHGFNDGPSYRFLATDAERVGDGFRGATVVPWQIIQEAVESAKGRRVLFIDTCHSGNAYNQKLGNAAYHANIIAYTAARFDQEAMEDSNLGHGLFTYAVVEGLEGKGTAKRELSTKELAEYVVKRVEELAKTLRGEQEPQYFKGRDAEDYVLARW
jgi:WD40 repeat protein